MSRLARPLSTAACLLLLGAAASAQISIAGYVFDDAAGPDLAILQPGANPQFGGLATGCVTANTLPGLTVPQSISALFDGDSTEAWCFGKLMVRLDFVDNVVRNGPGPDLVVFEIGGAEAFTLSILVESLCTWTAPRNYVPVATGFTQDLCGTGSQPINAAAIDLSDFGVLPGATVRRVLLDNKGVYGGAVGADPAAVLALHSDPASAVPSPCLLQFQQGIDAGAGPYLGAADTCLASDLPTTAFGASALEYSDSSPEHQLLLRFDGIVGSGAGQIPTGAQVQRALLYLTSGPGAGASNGTHSVHRLLKPWNAATATWAGSFGGDGVDADGIEAEVAAVATIPVTSASKTVAVDITAAVQAWANGAPNHGLAILANTTDGLGLNLAEASLESWRPALVVQVEGGVSYANAVASFAPVVVGVEPNPCNLDSSRSLGAPDADPNASVACCLQVPTSVTLGSGGSITLDFTSVSISGDGSPEPDLWIFEVGPDVEDTFVELSADLVSWVSLGKVFGATSSLDLDGFGIGPFDLYRYVRLTDDPLEGDATGCSPGADIDAVGVLSPNPWINLGQSLAGTGGAPYLASSAPLVAGGQAVFQLSNALPGAPTILAIGANAVGLPLFGGTLVPNPQLLIGPQLVGATGSLLVTLPLPVTLPAGVPFWVQSWILDPGGPVGFAASNAIATVTK
ncbi:DNRLRE domain-containing protein [Engelhardtia mirabilis]|uniref:Carbohydrate-binding module family 96 domain-containing protein n=1 Tax=Engelhardtia mirabilis TaxID=2528011 RepID=A0A518BP39_9BACT|nr:hypothetical protein Pla133_38470 [Planctomycetes bacterium Pla133]QDV03071.1 hypothetical protein Pla86_38460 [Planctomycetes bacterium Pla86]